MNKYTGIITSVVIFVVLGVLAMASGNAKVPDPSPPAEGMPVSPPSPATEIGGGGLGMVEFFVDGSNQFSGVVKSIDGNKIVLTSNPPVNNDPETWSNKRIAITNEDTTVWKIDFSQGGGRSQTTIESIQPLQLIRVLGDVGRYNPELSAREQTAEKITIQQDHYLKEDKYGFTADVGEGVSADVIPIGNGKKVRVMPDARMFTKNETGKVISFDPPLEPGMTITMHILTRDDIPYLYVRYIFVH